MAEEYYEEKYEEPQEEPVKKPGLIRRGLNWLGDHSAGICNVLMAAGLVSSGYQVGKAIGTIKAVKACGNINTRLQDHNMMKITMPDGTPVDPNNNAQCQQWTHLAGDVCGFNGDVTKPKNTL